jgi:hypothetical protein
MLKWRRTSNNSTIFGGRNGGNQQYWKEVVGNIIIDSNDLQGALSQILSNRNKKGDTIDGHTFACWIQGR